MSADVPALRERIQQSVEVTPGGCWSWFGSRNRDGYCSISVDGRDQKAHRVSYEAFVGPIPDGLVIDHLCRVRHCVNPEHLEPVTQAENIRRGLTGINNSVKTSCPYGHAYTDANTYVIPRTGSRTCRTCQRRRGRAYEATKRARDVPAASLRQGEPMRREAQRQQVQQRA